MRRTPQQWLTLFQVQSESYLSVKQFCLEQGISTSSFYKNKAAATPTPVTLQPNERNRRGRAYARGILRAR